MWDATCSKFDWAGVKLIARKMGNAVRWSGGDRQCVKSCAFLDSINSARGMRRLTGEELELLEREDFI